jgi:hypothetical protein
MFSAAGLYKGVTLSAAGTVPYLAVSFAAYDELKALLPGRKASRLEWWYPVAKIGCGAAAAVIAQARALPATRVGAMRCTRACTGAPRATPPTGARWGHRIPHTCTVQQGRAPVLDPCVEPRHRSRICVASHCLAKTPGTYKLLQPPEDSCGLAFALECATGSPSAAPSAALRVARLRPVPAARGRPRRGRSPALCSHPFCLGTSRSLRCLCARGARARCEGARRARRQSRTRWTPCGGACS